MFRKFVKYLEYNILRTHIKDRKNGNTFLDPTQSVHEGTAFLRLSKKVHLTDKFQVAIDKKKLPFGE